MHIPGQAPGQSMSRGTGSEEAGLLAATASLSPHHLAQEAPGGISFPSHPFSLWTVTAKLERGMVKVRRQQWSLLFGGREG